MVSDGALYQLEYNAAWRGGLVLAVPAHYASQTCSLCGYLDKDNRKEQAEFKCLACGHEEHAKVNATKNILHRALNSLAAGPQRLPGNTGEVMRVEDGVQQGPPVKREPTEALM